MIANSHAAFVFYDPIRLKDGVPTCFFVKFAGAKVAELVETPAVPAGMVFLNNGQPEVYLTPLPMDQDQEVALQVAVSYSVAVLAGNRESQLSLENKLYWPPARESDFALNE